jgi:hypothetical protein
MSASRRPAEAWGRIRLLLILGAAVLVVVVLVAGLVLAGTYAVTGERQDGASGSRPPQRISEKLPAAPTGQDAIAAAPMLQVDRQAALPTAPSGEPGPTMRIPSSTGVGRAGIAAGFPRTPEGAVAQLAAIGTAVLQGMSIPYTNDVYHQWAMPGGVGVAEWPMTRNVQAFLDAARMGQETDRAVSVAAIPAAGQVKGVDGPDWAVVCVLFEVRATISVEARIGYGYCERMQWHNRRWMIAPGVPPAQAPSTWPGSELSIRAGWRTWVDPVQE